MSEPLIVKNADSYNLDIREQDTSELRNCGTAEDNASQVPESDTREKLEADIYRAADEMDKLTHGERFINTHKILRWLDRQAAITEREVKLRELYKFEENHRANIDATEEVNRKLNERIAELTAERDELQAAIGAMGNGQFYAMYREACEERDALAAKVDDLNEHWRKANAGWAAANADAEHWRQLYDAK